MPRFAILRHDGPQGLHWDLMLETGPALATWSLPEPPVAAKPLVARPLADHRLAYLDYEGPISGGRGAATRWDAGTFQIERQEEGLLVAVLSGTRLSGRMTLRRTGEAAGPWDFSFEPA